MRYSACPTAVRASRLVSLLSFVPLSGARLVLLLAAVGMLAARPARADSPFEGKWTQGPVKEEYTVLKWQKECDAPPVNGSSGGGESISIHAEGDELSFVGGGRVFKTNQCYDQMPTLARETHTRNPSGREWRTRCATPPNDPRHAVMNTLVVATSDSHIDIIETGRYESQLAGGSARRTSSGRARSISSRATAPSPRPRRRLRPRSPPRPSRSLPPPPPSRTRAPRPATRSVSRRARRGSCSGRARATRSGRPSSTRPAAPRGPPRPGRSTNAPRRRSSSTRAGG